MQRNTAQIESRWEFLRSNELFGLHTGPLEQASLFVIGRAVYDSVYDLRESFRGRRFSDDERDRLRTEYMLREVYGEFLVPPFTLRLGRQQVVWGETDQFRALDVINPLDFRWHWYYEPWEDIRVTTWMARGIYDIGKLRVPRRGLRRGHLDSRGFREEQGLAGSEASVGLLRPGPAGAGKHRDPRRRRSSTSPPPSGTRRRLER